MLAAAAGVASDTIDWNFLGTYELLVAVLDAELEGSMAMILGAPDTETTGRLRLVIRQLERARRLVATVHARIQISPVIAAWHDRFHEFGEILVQGEMQQAGIREERPRRW